jgi:hypothetical protein
VDLTGKDPLVDPSSEWLRTPSSSEGRRSGERHRRRRRARKRSDIRAKIRLRMWIACTGVLIAMAVVLYLALGRQQASDSGFHLVNAPGTMAAAAAPALRAG